RRDSRPQIAGLRPGRLTTGWVGTPAAKEPFAAEAAATMTDDCAFHPLPGLVPAARHQIVTVIEQVRLARDTYRLRLAAPELAREAVPSQFFMIRQPGVTSPLLGRPFALFDTYLGPDERPAGIDVVYLVVGKMTDLMSGWNAGDAVELWGPLGNGYPAPQTDR